MTGIAHCASFAAIQNIYIDLCSMLRLGPSNILHLHQLMQSRGSTWDPADGLKIPLMASSKDVKGSFPRSRVRSAVEVNSAPCLTGTDTDRPGDPASVCRIISIRASRPANPSCTVRTKCSDTNAKQQGTSGMILNIRSESHVSL